MSHVRKQIRVAAETILSLSMVNYKHVFMSRIERSRDVMPYLLVYTPTELMTPKIIHPVPFYDRGILLIVQGKCRMTNDNLTFEDTMDEIATEIESKLTTSAMNSELSNKIKSIVLQTTDSEIVEDDNERTSATITLGWQVLVNTNEGDAETFI